MMPNETYQPIPQEVQDVAREVVDAALVVHRKLGPGLMERVYEQCLLHELMKRRLHVERQLEIPISYDGMQLDMGLRLDLLVSRCLIVELKSVEDVLPIHKAQLLTYLKLTGYRLGLLINFNVPLLKNGIKRVIL
jgi:GxxExxY protein